MTPERREEILAAARALPTDDYNKIVGFFPDAADIRRLRYWQEVLLARLGVGEVTFNEYIELFRHAKFRPAPGEPAAPDAPDAPDAGDTVTHPRLGVLRRDDFYLEGVIRLPIFCGPGKRLRREDDPPAEFQHLKIEAPNGAGVVPEQDAAIEYLIANERAVFDAVWKELAPEFAGFDLQNDVGCFGVEVSYLHVGGVAYLGFTIDADTHLEHGFQVIYHPTKGTSWGDWEALNCIEEADNLPQRPDDEEE
jgi:hypothetical protein